MLKGIMYAIFFTFTFYTYFFRRNKKLINFFNNSYNNGNSPYLNKQKTQDRVIENNIKPD